MKHLHTVPRAHEISGLTCSANAYISVISSFTLNINSNVTIYEYINAKPITRFILEMSIYNHYMD